jgi:hypothetical protein
MKSNLFILSALTSTLLIVTGCQSGSQKSSTHPTTGPGATTTTPPAVNPPTTPAPTTPAPASNLTFPIRIKAGSSAAVKDATGVEWAAETGFSGGDVIERPDIPIAGTTQPEIYRSEHYSMDSFSQKLPNGNYTVKLYFCETYDGITGPGMRVFTFELGGKTFKDFDVWVKSGGFQKAYVETVPVTVTNGQLDIKFTPQTENPQINAIEIIKG